MIKLITRLLMFVPLALLAIGITYKMDPVGVFYTGEYENEVREYLVSGENVFGYETLDGRILNELYAQKVEYAPEILVTGSSRVMLIDSDFTDSTKTFYNAGNTGADMYDFYTAYWIFAKEGKEPETIVMGIDPWIFNPSPDAKDKRSDKELYYEFMTEELGVTFTAREYVRLHGIKDKISALFDPAYFQESLKYLTEGRTVREAITVRDEELYTQEQVVKRPDGSIAYYHQFYEQSQEEIDYNAWKIANYGITRVRDFSEIPDNYKEYFEIFIEYLQNKGIKVILYLPPYHPTVYDMVVERNDIYHCTLELEEYLRQTAENYNLEIYGSFSPYEYDLTNADFYDGLHATKDAIQSILPIIE